MAERELQDQSEERLSEKDELQEEGESEMEDEETVAQRIRELQ